MRIVENAPLKSRRHCAGLYYVTKGVFEDRLDHRPVNGVIDLTGKTKVKTIEILSEVEVIQYTKEDGAVEPYWLARALWTNNLYTDPLPTKAAAMRQAEFMLDDRKKEIAEWIANVDAKKSGGK